MFPQIEKLKQELTDKYVVVNGSAPELMRFEGHVGQVKTVNMSGRALVQFDAWNNIGWYDIDVDFLTVVPKPDDSAEGKKHESRPAAAPKEAPAKAAKASAAGEKKLSPVEMARMQGAAGKTSAPAAKPAPAGGAKQSTADILAAARAKKAAVAAPEETTAAAAVAAPALAPAPQAAPAAKGASAPNLPAGQRPTVPQILVWCRQHDAK